MRNCAGSRTPSPPKCAKPCAENLDEPLVTAGRKELDERRFAEAIGLGGRVEAAYEFHWFEEHHLDMGRFVADNADLWVLIAEALEIAASRLVRKQRWGRKRARKVDALQRRLIEIARCSQGLARLSEGHPEWTAKRQNAWLLERIIEPGLANSMEYIPASGVWDGYCNSEFDSFDCRSYLTGRADRRLIRNGF